jgi:hypothetical protein
MLSTELEFSRTEDVELIRSVMTHPRIWPHISDDGSPPAGEFVPVMHSSIFYLEVRSKGALLGIFVFNTQSSICWEVHTCMLPHTWGLSRLATQQGAQWIFSHTKCERIVTTVPVTNRLALRLALETDMRVYGHNPESIRQAGVLQDTILLGISKPR